MKSQYITKKLTITLRADENLLISTRNTVKIRSKLKQVWKGDPFFGESGITHSICCIRKILKNFTDGQLKIDTIPKCGYRLIVNREIFSVKVQKKYKRIKPAY